MNASQFNVNLPLADLICRDPALDDATKELFILLKEVPQGTTATLINQFCQLFKRNYVWIEGYPPPPAYDRTAWGNRKRALKAIITGKLE